MNSEPENQNPSNPAEKVSVTLPGTVEKIIPSVTPKDTEKAQIHIEGAQPLYREIRVDNTLTDESGEEVKLKIGSHVDITIEANADAVIPTGDATDKPSLMDVIPSERKKK